jgi:hypothetical protein
LALTGAVENDCKSGHLAAAAPSNSQFTIFAAPRSL